MTGTEAPDFTNGPDGQLDLHGGTITSATIDISAVPIPGEVWLLGSGLIGLVGIRRRFQK